MPRQGAAATQSGTRLCAAGGLHTSAAGRAPSYSGYTCHVSGHLLLISSTSLFSRAREAIPGGGISGCGASGARAGGTAAARRRAQLATSWAGVPAGVQRGGARGDRAAAKRHAASAACCSHLAVAAVCRGGLSRARGPGEDRTRAGAGVGSGVVRWLRLQISRQVALPEFKSALRLLRLGRAPARSAGRTPPVAGRRRRG